MKFKYFGLDYNLLNNLEEETLYVFRNFNDKIQIENSIKDLFATYNFISESEFWEKYLLSEKIILKEEKEVIFFYQCLDEDFKEKHNINNYFACIDFAYRYYSFMKEYLEYEINLDKINLYSWQKIIIDEYLKIHENMLKKSNLEKRIPRYLISKFFYLNEEYIKKYKKVVFIDKFSFTNLEKKYLKNIDNLEIHLKLDKCDYNEKENYIINLDLDKISKEKLKIYSCNDNFTQLINLIDNKDVFDTFYDFENNIKNELKNENLFLDQNLICSNINFSLSKTTIYQILNNLYELFNNSNKNKYLLMDIYSLFSIDIFRKEFNISNISLQKIMNFSKNKYIYLSKNELEELKIFDEISSYKTFDEYLPFLEKIGKIKSEKDNELNVSYIYFEALAEIKNLDFTILDNFNKNILKIFLKYLDAKKVNVILEKTDIKIMDLKNLSSLKKEKFALINANGNVKLNLPELLTKNQRNTLNLPIAETIINEKLFDIYVNMYNANEVYVSYIKNEEENVSEASFLTELIFLKDINVIKKEISTVIKSKMLNQLFNKNKIKEFDNKVEDNVIKSEKNKSIESISVTNFLKLYNSELQYYLEKNTDEIDVFDKEISALTKGNIIHRILELFFSKYNKKIFEIEKNALKIELKKFIEIVKKEYENKIYTEYVKLFEYVNLSTFFELVYKFLLELKEIIPINDIKNIYFEKEVNFKLILENKQEILINGKIDLIIETSNYFHVIDYKSGKYSKDKENEYKDQLYLYSLMDNVYGTKEFKGYLSFILDENILKEVDFSKSKLNKEKVLEILNNYIKNDIFDIGKVGQYSYVRGLIENDK